MIKTILKFLFAGGLIFWLIQSGKLDFSLIGLSMKHGPQWPIAILVLSVQAIITSIRFKFILQTKSKISFSYLEIIKATWIGLFFSSILPGAVTGDFVKLFYIKRLDPKLSKTFLLTSVMLDRIFGLLGLLCVSALFSFIYYKEVTNLSPLLVHIISINFLLFLGGLTFFVLLFLSRRIQRFLIHYIEKIPKFGSKINSVLKQVFTFGDHKKIFVFCFLLSLITQFANIFVFWFLTSPFYAHPIPLSYAFTFIPIGLIAVAIPISPGGLGVGHALFQNLFSIVGITNGASLFNLHYIANIIVNLLGSIPYLLTGKKPSEKELEEFNEIESSL